MSQGSLPDEAIAVSNVNSFHYLRKDADLFLELAKSAPHSESHSLVQFSRTSILLDILSLEAIVNRALSHCLSGAVRDIILQKEKHFSLLEKWEMLPKLVRNDASQTFDKSAYPWSHLKELVAIRNDYVHPKSHRPVFYRIIRSTKRMESLDPDTMPDELTYTDESGQLNAVSQKTLLYCQTRIPKDPTSVLPEHAERVRKVVDDTIQHLDQLMGGVIQRDNWLLKDEEVVILHPANVRGQRFRWQRMVRQA